ncbi:hypothetical protein K7432_003023 [Basidiobolus ranarum]|uniref:Uncharacterized protein n=1 Tax=Basidiobolus ranarum TaxID=34480 RepID=A0ABR2X0J7_9FUNG
MPLRFAAVTIFGIVMLATVTPVFAKNGIYSGDGYDLISALYKLYNSAIKPLDGVEYKVASGELTPSKAAKSVANVAKEIMEQSIILVKKYPISARKKKAKLYELKNQYTEQLKEVVSKIEEVAKKVPSENGT